MASLSEIVEHELGASPRSKLSITSESSLASVASLSMPMIQEIVLSADIRCSDCQEKIADIMSRMIETYSVLVSVLEKKVTLTCTYSGERRVSKSYGEALLCKISIFKRRMFHSSKKQQAEGASFRDQPYGRELPQGLWTTGLCDCHQDPHICVQTAIMPCISFAQNTEIVNRGTIRCMEAGLIHLALGFVGCCWVYAFPSRSRLREHFALPEEPCSDFWVHLFCTSCAICQEARELKNRGVDPSISWLSNVEKWNREKVTPPIVVPGMIR